MQGDALLRSGRPRRTRLESVETAAVQALNRIGADAFALLVARNTVQHGARCNLLVLGVAAQVELHGVAESTIPRMLSDAKLDKRSVRHSLKLWRELLANLDIDKPEKRLQVPLTVRLFFDK